jgi:hypothetical protein
VRRALSAVFGGAISKDTVSRVWRKVKGDLVLGPILGNRPEIERVLGELAGQRQSGDLRVGWPGRMREGNVAGCRSGRDHSIQVRGA